MCGRDIGINEEQLDKPTGTDDRGEGGSRVCDDGRLLAPHRRVLEGDQSCRGVSIHLSADCNALDPCVRVAIAS